MVVMRKLLGMDRANVMPAVAAGGVLLLLLAGAVMVMYNEQSYKEAKTQQVEAQSRILASTVTAALAFDDRKAAREYVNALAVDPQTQVAAVYDAHGDLFAAYCAIDGGTVPPVVRNDARGIDGDRLVVTVPVRQANSTLGTVYLQLRRRQPRRRP